MKVMGENNVKLTEADAIFIPKDIDGDISDYTEYKVGLYRSVPDNCNLVTINNFTGKIVNRGGRGFKLTLPWITKSILVPAIDRVIDYPSGNYLTLDHITAGIDIAIGVRIEDPVKYVNSGKYQLEQLAVLVQSLLRMYVQSLEFASISKGNCPVSVFDNGKRLKTFCDDYGIKVTKVIFKEVKLPQELQKQYDDVIEAKKKREKQLVELNIRKDEAIARKEIADIDADIYIMKYEKLIRYLKSEGVPSEGIADLIKTQMISENANASFFVGENDAAKNIAAGVAAGNGYNRTLKK